MLKEKENNHFVQTELNDPLKKIGDIDKSISSGEIEAAINRLRHAKRLAEQQQDITEYDEQLVRRLIEKITVYDERVTVEFKSGTSVDVRR